MSHSVAVSLSFTCSFTSISFLLIFSTPDFGRQSNLQMKACRLLTDLWHSQRPHSWTYLGQKSLQFSSSPLLTDFIPTPPPPHLSKSGLKLVCNVNIVQGNLILSTSSMPKNLKEIVRSWIRLQYSILHSVHLKLVRRFCFLFLYID